MKWTRFRQHDPSTWHDREFWPDEAGDEGEILVYDGCNGFEIWWRFADQTPPGTHWAKLEAPTEAVAEHHDHIRQHYNGPSPLEHSRRPA